MDCPYRAEQTSGNIAQGREMEYSDYLGLARILSAQNMVSERHGNKIHDEHMFMVIHEVFELWFKQIIVEVDSVNELMNSFLDERNTHIIIRRLGRVNLILKLVNDQFPILETMTPLDFMDFSNYLVPASGFQSVQFRILENKIGVKMENRVKYQQKNYKDTFSDEKSRARIETSEVEQSLRSVIESWLERTPGNEKNTTMWDNFTAGVEKYLHERFYQPYEAETDAEDKEKKRVAYEKQKDTFDAILDETKYNEHLKQGNRRFSHNAFKGAMMIFLYRDEPRFHQPFQLLTALMDIDSHLMTWRHNHAMTVQRMTGSKTGPSNSSGYLYLRTTIADRYKVFVDLFNMSTYLLPREYIPPLDAAMKTRLAFSECPASPAKTEP